MSRTDNQARLSRYKDSLAQINQAIFEVSPTNKYAIQMLVQERSYLSREIAICKEREAQWKVSTGRK